MDNNLKITNTIREAILENSCRPEQYESIMKSLDCSRNKAKQLLFAFIYRAEEKFLQAKLKESD